MTRQHLAGDFFGEIALTVSKQRTADVKSIGASGPGATQAQEPVELFQLLRTDFESTMERYPILQTRLAQIGQVGHVLLVVPSIRACALHWLGAGLEVVACCVPSCRHTRRGSDGHFRIVAWRVSHDFTFVSAL